MSKFTTFLWYNNDAIEAAKFYVSLFADAKLLAVDGRSARFQLGEQQFVAFNGGEYFKLNTAVSIMVDCPTQPEIDALWVKLLAGGGQESRCGWLVDRFGLSWQVTPVAVMDQTIGNSDPQKAQRATAAMMTMNKLDIAALQKAANGV
jgi:predicted 3-demethylubiquinone-9 3-methyltransferase (glyoxalase superfamily)